MTILDQLTKMIDGVEFSDKVKDKIKELSVKARLRKEAGQKEEDCLTGEEKDELIGLIKADMVLDAIEIKTQQAYLDELDKIIYELDK
jgi:hypothetical protein